MLVLLDSNSIIYRAYHKAPPLSSPEGVPTGAVHIFFSILEKVKKQLSPSNIIAVFDSHGKTSRHSLYSDYKANRESMPEDLIPQIKLTKELLSLMGIPVYSKVGIEADDIIGSLALSSTDEKVVIVTKDKDLFQLVSDKIKIYDDSTGNLLGSEETFVKYGVYPHQIVDYLSFVGDSSDNIKGVKGVGPKTASKLIASYGSLDGVYENIEDLKGKLKENLIADKENVYLAKKLITLESVELFEPIRSEDLIVLKDRLVALGMRSVAKKIFLGDINSASEEPEEVIHMLPPVEEGDVEKTELMLYIQDNLYVSDGKNFELYVSSKHPIESSCIYYDIKEILKVVNIDIATSPRDYLLISWLCESDKGTLKKGKEEPIGEFIARILSLKPILDTKLEKLNLLKLYTDLELPVSYVLSSMEVYGVKINPQKVKDIAELLQSKIMDISKRIFEIAGCEFNLNSPKQLAEYLYDTINLHPVQKNKRSTAEDVLLELLSNYPEHAEILQLILSYRENSKLLSTYTQSLLDALKPDGRIHTTYKQTGTGTGRLSSISPNLQNIPTGGELSNSIRSIFVSKPGYKFVSVDYSQIELRILAHLSNDIKLKEAFAKGLDIHTMTAMNIFGLSESAVTPESRRLAKAVNFGVIYGLSPFGLSRDAGISTKEAKNFIDNYFSLYSGVKNYISQTINFTREHGYCETIFGRKRFFPEIKSHNSVLRQRAERAAMNAPLQGSAADIIKVAMIDADKYISGSDLDVNLCLQIHDELVFEVKENETELFIKEIKNIMESSVKLDVPLIVNVNDGYSWGEL